MANSSCSRDGQYQTRRLVMSWNTSSCCWLLILVVLALQVLLTFIDHKHFADAQSTSRHVVAAIPGDLVIGALFPVHHAPVLKVSPKHFE